jgi:hypothetical protein
VRVGAEARGIVAEPPSGGEATAKVMERIARREQASAAPTSGEATPWKRKHAAAKRLAQITKKKKKNMSKNILLILSLLLLFSSASAQVLQVSEAFDIGRDSELRILGRYDEKILLFGRQRGRFFVAARSDTSLVQIWRKELDLSNQSEFPLLFVMHEFTFSMILHRYEQGQTIVSVVELDTSGAVLRQVDALRLKDRLNLEAEDFVLSENKRFLGLALSLPSRRMELASYDILDFRQLMQRSDRIAETDPLREHFHSLINNVGELYLFFDQNTQRKQLKKHQIRLISFDTVAMQRDYFLPMTDLHLYTASASFDERNGQVVLAGYSSTDNMTASGFFYGRLNPQLYSDDGAGVSVKNTPFELSFLRSVTASRRKKISGIPNLQVRQLILRQDGGCTLIGEQIAVKNYELNVNPFPNTPMNTRQQADYWLGNVVLTACHPDGSLHWQNVLHKNQHSENDFAQFSSYLLLKTPTALRLIFNQEVYSGTPIYEYSVDALGNNQRRLLDQRFGKQSIKFKKGVQTGSNEAFLLSEHFHRFYLLKISYP